MGVINVVRLAGPPGNRQCCVASRRSALSFASALDDFRPFRQMRLFTLLGFTMASFALALAGCRETAHDKAAASAQRLPRALRARSSSSPLQLLAFAHADTITVADSLAVTVAFRGDSAWRRLHYDFEFLNFDVIGPDGRPLPSNRLYAFNSGIEVALEPYGFWGMPVALACPTPDAPNLPRRCAWNFRLGAPGTYRVVARFQTPPPPDVASPVAGRDFIELTSDTVRIVYAPRQEIEE